MSEDPLAPPEGYGAARQARGPGQASLPGQPGFERCCQAGCGAPAYAVLTLGCRVGEHIGEFPYCLHEVAEIAVKGRLPACGRCHAAGRRSLMDVRRIAGGQVPSPFPGPREAAQAQSALDWAFEKGHAGGQQE